MPQTQQLRRGNIHNIQGIPTSQQKQGNSNTNNGPEENLSKDVQTANSKQKCQPHLTLGKCKSKHHDVTLHPQDCHDQKPGSSKRCRETGDITTTGGMQTGAASGEKSPSKVNHRGTTGWSESSPRCTAGRVRARRQTCLPLSQQPRGGDNPCTQNTRMQCIHR